MMDNRLLYLPVIAISAFWIAQSAAKSYEDVVEAFAKVAVKVSKPFPNYSALKAFDSSLSTFKAYTSTDRLTVSAFNTYTTGGRERSGVANALVVAHNANNNNPHSVTPTQVFGQPTSSKYPLFKSDGSFVWTRPLVACGTDPATSIFDGKNATFRCSSTTTLAAGSPASVRNDGDISDAILKFSIPQGVQGLTGRPNIFCNISVVVRAFKYDSSSTGLNPSPSLSSFAVQVWNGAVRVIAQAFTWWTGGTANHVYGTGTASTFTPSVYAQYSGHTANNYVAVQVRYSSASTGIQYCTTGTPIAVTKQGTIGPQGPQGANATVTEASVMTAFASPAKSDNSLNLMATSAGSKSKIVISDSAAYPRIVMTSTGLLLVKDTAGNIRFGFDTNDYTFTIRRNGNIVYKVWSTGRTTWFRPNGTTPIMRIYTSGVVVL